MRQNMGTSPIQSRWANILVALFFCFSGAFACLLLLLCGTTLWYFPCALLWMFAGVVWLFRPSFGATLSSFPVLGLAVMMVQLLPHFRAMDVGYRVLLLCVVALTMILGTLRKSGPGIWLPLAISFSFVLMSFGVDRRFRNKLTIHQYSMNWSANGVAPWGRVETNEKGESPVVIYRRVQGGYCYDAIFSTELKTRLSANISRPRRTRQRDPN